MKTLSTTLSVLMLSIGLSACANNPLMQKQSINAKAQEALKEGAQIAKSKPQAMPQEISDELFEPAKIEPAKSLAKKVEPRFDLVVTKAPVSQVLMGIVSGTPYSMVLHPDMVGEISVNLKDVTLFEALNSLRELYGLEYKMNGKQIYVEPQTLQTRVFQVNYITGSRKGSSGTKVSSGTISNTTSNASGASSLVATNAPTTTNEQSFASDVTMTSDNDFWGDISSSLDSLIGREGGRKLVINKQSGLIMVKAMPKEIRQVEKFLKLMQVTVDRQVILEAKIIKVELNNGSQQGVNWAMFRKVSEHNVSFGNVSGGTTLNTADNLNLTTSSITSNLTSLANASTTGVSAIGNSMFALALQGAKFSALLNFLETQGNVEVLSSPRIATINNQKAVLKVGTDAFFVTNVRTNVTPSVGGGAPIVTPDIQMQPYFSGISLDVTPQIDQDDNITLHVHPLISEVTQVNRTVTLAASAGGTYTIPTASSKINETDSIVRTRDGNVIAIGGLMTESTNREKSKIPGLGDVKGLGNLFRQKAEASTKSELVILLKSTVVRSGDNWAQDMLDTQERIEKLKGEDF